MNRRPPGTRRVPGGHAAAGAPAEGAALAGRGAVRPPAGVAALVALAALGGEASVCFVLRSASQDSSNSSSRQHGAERTASRYNTIPLQLAAATPIYCILQALRVFETGCIVPSEDDQGAKASK
jgi:hypothetical protein